MAATGAEKVATGTLPGFDQHQFLTLKAQCKLWGSPIDTVHFYIIYNYEIFGGSVETSNN